MSPGHHIFLINKYLVFHLQDGFERQRRSGFHPGL